MIRASASRRTEHLRGPHREHHAASVEPKPKTHPKLFTADGKRKWKVPPAGVKVELNKSAYGTWIERWPAPGGKPGAPVKWVYNYTLEEVQRRAGIKFAENRELAKHIPAIRAELKKDLGGPAGEKREVAMVLTLIDKLYLRVGGEESADHDHFGATTLEKRHVHVHGDTVRLKFTGKSGVKWDVRVEDSTLAQLMTKQLARLRSPEGRVFHVGADDVNKYLEPFGATAKKFRTFHATRLAREELLKVADAPRDQRAQRVKEAIERVAEKLGHTPAVSRESYIDPMVIAAYMKGKLR